MQTNIFCRAFSVLFCSLLCLTSLAAQDTVPPVSAAPSGETSVVSNTTSLDMTTKVAYEVTGIVGPKMLEDGTLIADAVSTPSFKPVGFVRIVSDASNVTIEITDIKREPVEHTVETNGNVRIVKISKSGKFWVEVMAIDFPKNIFQPKTVVIEIPDSPGPGPEPEPGPEPGPEPEPEPGPDPAGPFDGIASKIAVKYKAAISVDHRNQLIRVFETAADNMQSFQWKQQRQVLDYIVDNRPDSVGNAGLLAFYDFLAVDSKGRLSSWDEAIAYYREIAKGLK